MLIPVCAKKHMVIADRKALEYCRRQNHGQGCVHFRLAIDLKGINNGKHHRERRKSRHALPILSPDS